MKPYRKILSLLGRKSTSGEKEFIDWLKNLTGLSPKNISLYRQAFSHSSVVSKKNENLVSYERLEFLGDAVLSLIVAEHLFNLYPYKDEGFLTQLRSKIVNGQNLKNLAIKLGFNQFIKTSLKQNAKNKSSIYGDAFEALIGAIYLDKGFASTKNFILKKIIQIHIDIEGLAKTNEDYKSQLQIYCQKKKWTLEYKLVDEEKNKNQFAVQIFINEKPMVLFEHYSKRIAEQKAAQLTLEQMEATLG